MEQWARRDRQVSSSNLKLIPIYLTFKRMTSMAWEILNLG